MVKQINDMLLWASDIKQAYKSTVRYLQLVGKNWIILNRKKIVFAEEEVDFAGFHLTTDGVKPLSKHLETIRNFHPPRGTSVTCAATLQWPTRCHTAHRSGTSWQHSVSS